MAHPARTPAPPAAETVGRRERKKLATRAAVREASLRLAVRHGVENVTVEQIAAEADIALRTFFNHFSSKEEAVVAAATAGAEALVAEFRARPGEESVLQALREAVLAVMDRDDAFTRDHVQAWRLMRDTPALVPHQMVVLTTQERTLAEAVAERAGPVPTGGPGPFGDVYPQLCAAAALAALRVVFDRWLGRVGGSDDPSTVVLREEIDEALTQLAAGFDRPGRGLAPE